MWQDISIYRYFLTPLLASVFIFCSVGKKSWCICVSRLTFCTTVPVSGQLALVFFSFFFLHNFFFFRLCSFSVNSAIHFNVQTWQLKDCRRFCLVPRIPSGLKSVPSDWGFRLPHSGPCSYEDAVWLSFHSSPVFYRLKIGSDGELSPSFYVRTGVIKSDHSRWFRYPTVTVNDGYIGLSRFCSPLIHSSLANVLMFYFVLYFILFFISFYCCTQVWFCSFSSHLNSTVQTVTVIVLCCVVVLMLHSILTLMSKFSK